MCASRIPRLPGAATAGSIDARRFLYVRCRFKKSKCRFEMRKELAISVPHFSDSLLFFTLPVAFIPAAESGSSWFTCTFSPVARAGTCRPNVRGSLPCALWTRIDHGFGVGCRCGRRYTSPWPSRWRAKTPPSSTTDHGMAGWGAGKVAC